MKKITITTIVLLFAFNLFAQEISLAEEVKQHYSELDTSKITTGILYDRVLPFSGIENFDGKTQVEVCSQAQWKQIYFELQNATQRDTAGQHDLGFIFGRKNQFTNGKLIPIYIANYQYNKIKENAVEDELLLMSGDKIVENPDKSQSPYEQKRVFVATPYMNHTYYGENFEFMLNGNYLYTNTGEEFVEIFANFNDGMGEREIEQGDRISISYAETGIKTISIKAITNTEDTLTTNFSFDVRAKSIPAYETEEINAGFNGNNTSGELAIIKSPNNNLLDNPILIVEGFDIQDNMYFEEMWSLFNKQNFAECLLQNGYDIIFLNFNEPRTDLRVNAQLVKEAIEKINADKVSNNELVIAGGSMGGLVTRTALTYMEAFNIEHHTRLFISFDSPQNGANIPIGLQHFLKFASENDNVAALDFIGRLNDKASKQMLLYHHLATNEDENTTAPHSDRATFEYYIQTTGDYPEELRKIAISNGTANGTILSHPDDDLLIFYKAKYNSTSKIRAKIWAMPNSEDKEKILKVTVGNVRVKRVRLINDYKIDYAPGGKFGSLKTMGETAPDDFTIYQDDHCFIPTISSLDINTNDFEYNIANDPDILSKTPFDAIYYPVTKPSINQEHVNVSNEFAHALQKEIIPENIILPNQYPYWNEGDVRAGNSIRLTSGFHASASDKVHLFVKPKVNCIVQTKNEIFSENCNIKEGNYSTKTDINSKNEEFTVYPNPNYGEFTINVNNNEIPLFYTITDYVGNVIIKEHIINESIKVNNLTSGIYLITVYYTNKSLTKKIIIL